MQRIRGFLLAGATVLALGGVLSACSSSGPDTASLSAQQIFEASKTAMTNLTSVNAKGTVVAAGKHTKIDLDVTSTNSGGAITINNSTVNVIVTTNKDIYFKANLTFWEQTANVPASVASLLANRWVTGITASQASGFTQLLNLKSLIQETFTASTVTKGAVTTIDGQSAIPLTSAKAGVGYVAASGPAYLLKIVSPHNGAKGEITFSGFDATTAPSTPTNAVNITKFLGG